MRHPDGGVAGDCVISRARYSGGKPDRDRREVRIAVRMGLWSVAITSLPLMALLFVTQPTLLFFRQELSSPAADAAIFVSALGIGLPFALSFQALRSFPPRCPTRCRP